MAACRTCFAFLGWGFARQGEGREGGEGGGGEGGGGEDGSGGGEGRYGEVSFLGLIVTHLRPVKLPPSLLLGSYARTPLVLVCESDSWLRMRDTRDTHVAHTWHTNTHMSHTDI